MNILITSPSLDPNHNISGISSVVQFIINSNRIHKYSHFELGRRDNQKRNPAWLFHMLALYRKWFILMIKGKDVLVHFNLPLCRFSIIRDFPLILMTRLMGRKMIIHLHGGNYLMEKTPPEWMKILWKFIFSGKYPTIVLSPKEEEILKKRIPIQKVYSLPNCIDLKEAYSFERSYSDNNVVTLLYLGRIAIDKGIEYIYLAMHALKSRNVRFKFIMAGKGPDEENYCRKFDDLLGKDFEFKGVVAGNQKTEILERCNVFLLPSFYEGLPMALLESMSYGLVPVTTNVGSINQVVTDGINGIFVKTHSSIDIEDAIENISLKPELRNMLGRNAKQFIFNNFNPELYVTKLNEIYNYE